MANIFTDDEKKRIAEREKDKLKEEIKARHKELGLENMKPLQGQSEYQQLNDLDAEGRHIQETMKAEEEKRLAKKEKERKERIARRSSTWAIERYKTIKEHQAKEAFEKRRISL